MPEPRTTVLNVNTDASRRDGVSRALRGAGFEVREASDPREALRHLALACGPDATAALDLVVLDVDDGAEPGPAEVCRLLRADPATASIPLLHLSGAAGACGADSLLVPPVAPEALIASVQALLRVRRAEEEARALACRWESTFDAISDAVVLIDPRGELLRCNESAELLFGQPRHRLAGQGLAALLRGMGLHDASVLEVASGSARTAAVDVALTAGWFRLSAEPVRDERNQVVGGVRVFTDVTERRRLEEELSARAEALALADRHRDQFLAMLGHELRNPLAAISAGVHMLERMGSPEPQVRTTRERVSRQLRHLTRMVDDLLDVSHLTRGHIELRREPVELVEAIRAAVEASRPVLEAKGHAVELSLPPPPVQVWGDPCRLEQVLVNLLDNAAKYTPSGGRIRIGLQPVDGVVEIRVRDTGIGIPADLQSTVFDTFVQGDQSLERSGGGLGLGLALVKGLVQLHGGSVSVESAGLDQGSEFSVRLPLQSAASVTGSDDGLGGGGGQPGAAPGDGIAPALGTRRRVLLVEDNTDAREALRDLLEDFGHSVETAIDGPAGVARALELRPDVALIDIGLPRLDGYQVAQAIRAEERGRSLFLVALTGYGGSQQQRQALDAGFDLHLVKPVDPEALLKVLEQVRPGAA